MNHLKCKKESPKKLKWIGIPTNYGPHSVTSWTWSPLSPTLPSHHGWWSSYDLIYLYHEWLLMMLFFLLFVCQSWWIMDISGRWAHMLQYLSMVCLQPHVSKGLIFHIYRWEHMRNDRTPRLLCFSTLEWQTEIMPFHVKQYRCAMCIVQCRKVKVKHFFMQLQRPII